jgi:hypothetical protein
MYSPFCHLTHPVFNNACTRLLVHFRPRMRISILIIPILQFKFSICLIRQGFYGKKATADPFCSLPVFMLSVPKIPKATQKDKYVH